MSPGIRLVAILLAMATVPGATLADPLAAGANVYEEWCGGCHGAHGSGTQALQRKYKGAEPPVLTERGDLNDELVRYAVRNGISFMPYFRKTEISDKDLDALATFLATPPAKRVRAR